MIRLYNRLRFHNKVYVSDGSAWSVGRRATVRDCQVRLNGGSEIRIGAGAQLRNVSFQVDSGSHVRIGEGVILEGVEVCVWRKSELVLEKDGQFRGVAFSVENGKVHIAENNLFDSGTSMLLPRVSVKDGRLEIGEYNSIKGSLWVRFGGEAVLGKYNCINEQTEIRADESVRIGSYNMISYSCDIWDTNTHCAYSLEEKQKMFERDFPLIGKERKRPRTAPVRIGDGNWIGKYACILKGVTIHDNVTVGTRAVVSNMVIEDGEIVVSPKGSVL